MQAEISIVFHPADGDVARAVRDHLERAARVRVVLEQTAIPVNETWDRGLSSAGVIVLLSPDSVPAKSDRETWRDVIAHAGQPPVATVLVRSCPYPALLERRDHFVFTKNTLRELHRWAMAAGGSRAEGPRAPGTAWDTSVLWDDLVDRPGVAHVDEWTVGRQFAHEAAGHYRDVIVVSCQWRAEPMIAGEVAAALSVQLRGNSVEADEQLATALAEERVLLLLEGFTGEAPFVRMGQASVLYTPAGATEPGPSAKALADTFATWSSRAEECGRLLPLAERAIVSGGWPEAGRLGQAVFSFLKNAQRWFEAAWVARQVGTQALEHGDKQISAWSRDELSWLEDGGRVRTPTPPAVQPSLW